MIDDLSFESLPLPTQREIHEVCEKYEIQRRDLDSPQQFWSFVDAASEQARPQLVKELFRIDFEYRYGLAFDEDAGAAGVEIKQAVEKLGDVATAARQGAPKSLPGDPADNARSPETTIPSRADAPPLPVLDDYEIRNVLGEGGMGTVYRARQISTNRPVALKVMRADREADVETHDRFRKEIEAAAKVDHENVVTIYDAGQVGGRPYLAMKLVDGPSLSKAAETPLENREAADCMRQVAIALGEIHSSGILHRDLKPANILIDRTTNRPLVTDFGLAQLPASADATRTGAVFGSPPYMSPEQAKDAGKVDVTTDIYSLGATLYQILTGRPPFTAATPVETLRQVTEDEPISPRGLNPAVDRDLETICLKCLSKEPARRYAKARDVADDLQRYLAGEPIQARPISSFGRTIRWCKRKPWKAGAVAALVALVVLAVTGGLFHLHKTEQQRRAADVVASFWSNMLMTVHPAIAQGRQVTVRELIEETAPHIEKDYPGQSLARARLHETAGIVFSALGDYSRGEEHWRKAHRLHVDQQGEDSPAALGALSRIARELHKQGEWEKAEEILRPVLIKQRRRHGNTHPDTILTISRLASLLATRGNPKQRDEAEQLFAEEVELSRRVYGANHQRFLEALSGQAGYYLRVRDFERAVPLHEETLAKRRKILGIRHPDTLTTLGNTVSLYLTMGRLEEAEPLAREGAEVAALVLGPRHPDTLIMESSLAELAWRRKDFAAAEQAFRRLVDLGREGAAPEEFLRRLNMLVAALTEQDKLDEASEIFLELQSGCEATFGKHDARTLAVMNNRAELLRRLGRHDVAIELHWKVYQIKTENIGEGHESTIMSQFNHARIIFDRDGPLAAQPLMRSVSEKAIAKLPKEHGMREVYTRQYKGCLSSLEEEGTRLAESGDFAAAEPYLVRLHEVLHDTAVGGLTNPATRRVGKKLADVYEALGKKNEAAKLRPATDRSY